MFRNLLIAATCAGACAFSAQAQELDYTTTCHIEDGEAVGYISVRRPASLSFSGEIIFYIYDDDDERIDELPVMTSTAVTNSDLTEIESVDVDRYASWCAVDISGAIDEPGMERRPYMTTCYIDDGAAIGYAQLTDGASLRFSGRIRFLTFYEDGEYLDEYFDQASIVLVGRNRREVSTVEVRDDAFSCTLDLSGAL